MGHLRSTNKVSKANRAVICQFIKPFNKCVPPLVGRIDKRYISSGGNTDDFSCSHEYCLAERRRIYGSEEGMDEPQKPVGLPWASGLLKYIPGHLQYEFPLRKKVRPTPRKLPSSEPSKPDKITNPDICGVLQEMILAYKVFMLAGMIISEAKAAAEEEKMQEERISEAKPAAEEKMQGERISEAKPAVEEKMQESEEQPDE